MCQNCKAAPLAQERQKTLQAALDACRQAGINPHIHGFLVRHARGGKTPQYTSAQRTALERYNTAAAAMKRLHEDYVWSLARQAQNPFAQHVQQKTDQELVDICNQPRRNTDTILYGEAAHTELVIVRSKALKTVSRNEKGTAIYALEGE